MEWTAVNSRDTKHWITVIKGDEDEASQDTINVVRLRTGGGVPKTVVIAVESDIGFGDALKKIKNVMELDEEIYNMLSSHTNVKSVEGDE